MTGEEYVRGVRAYVLYQVRRAGPAGMTFARLVDEMREMARPPGVAAEATLASIVNGLIHEKVLVAEAGVYCDVYMLAPKLRYGRFDRSSPRTGGKF